MTFPLRFPLLRRIFLTSRSFSSLSAFIDPSKFVGLEEQKAVLREGVRERIRNFGIIAHVDHGKSTLADRLLEMAGNIKQLRPSEAQVLDTLQVERERGITVKAQTASLFFRYPKDNQIYLLNLIDTPGHVDFTYEVSRSMAACQGVLLLVDASQGIQAQTLANFHLAMEANLNIIPVITKIDIAHANTKKVAEEMINTFDCKAEDILYCSSKTGVGITEIFPRIVEQIKPPEGILNENFRGLLFDSWYTSQRGVICLISVKDGEIRKGDKIESYHGRGKYEVQEVGILKPAQTPVEILRCGQVGYMIANIRQPKETRLGETFFKTAEKAKSLKLSAQEIRKTIKPLPGFQPAKSMVYAGLYPVDGADFPQLKKSLEKLSLNDPSVTFSQTASDALGAGFRCGFLGMLHMDVFQSRLLQEFGAEVIVTAPTVPFKMIDSKGVETRIETPSDFPDDPTSHKKYKFLEPQIQATIICPDSIMSEIYDLIGKRRGKIEKTTYISGQRVLLVCDMPLSEIIVDFHDKIQTISSGFASFDYQLTGYKPADLVKVEIKINGEVITPLCSIVPSAVAYNSGRTVVERLKKEIRQQNFEVVIQASIGKRVIARERIAPYRKNVLLKHGKTVGGGDESRKKKLLEEQKENLKKAKLVGNIHLSQKVFQAVMQRE